MYGLFPLTYKDEWYKERQCHQARRSLEDIIEIIQTYYPEVTEREIARWIIELVNEKNMRCHFCGNVRKFVFINDSPVNWDGISIGESSMKGDGKYSIQDIFKLAGMDFLVEKQKPRNAVAERQWWISYPWDIQFPVEEQLQLAV